MSGRAGRRGLDDKGIVMLMIDQKVTPTVVKEMVQGKADPINSAFHLTYNMVSQQNSVFSFSILEVVTFTVTLKGIYLFFFIINFKVYIFII